VSVKKARMVVGGSNSADCRKEGSRYGEGALAMLKIDIRMARIAAFRRPSPTALRD
jgi:hypothetical protein